MPATGLELVPLGTNGFYPSWGRQTMSFLLRRGDRALLLDAGSGVGRLFSTHPELLAGIGHLEILLTHYHLDHVVGLACLSHAWRKPLVIHAPEAPLVDAASAVAALEGLLSPPLFPITLHEFAERPEIRPYRGASLRVFELDLRVRRQRHPGGSVGVRLGDTLAYVTDTAADEATAELARGVDLLLHEVWVTDDEGRANPRMLTGHAAVSEVLELARRAAVRRLLPVHHQPKRTREELEEMVAGMASQGGVEVALAEEGQRYTLRS